MAEVKISPNEIRDALAKHVAAYKPGAAAKDEIGSVTEAGDGIARVEGLPSTMTNELLKFENGTLGLALNLDVREVGVVTKSIALKPRSGRPTPRMAETPSGMLIFLNEFCTTDFHAPGSASINA